MSYVKKTLNANATTGYIIQLTDEDGTLHPCGKVTLQTVGIAYFKWGAGTPPPTPTNAYIPGAGATTDTLEIPANDGVVLGADSDGQGKVVGLQEGIEWIAVWAQGGGSVRIVGH